MMPNMCRSYRTSNVRVGQSAPGGVDYGLACVLSQLPTTALRFPVTPNFVYRAAGVRPKS